MSLFRGVANPRLLVGVLATITFVAYFGGFSSSWDLASSMMASRGAATPIDGLAVSLKQSETSPPTITVTVTNNNPGPVTVVSYESPLDPIALQLGLLKITPDGASEPLELATVQVRRKWPPSADLLIGLAPGESKESKIVLKEPVVSPDQLGGKASVQLKGNWMVVWPQAKEEVVKSSLDDISSNSDVSSGSYETSKLAITIG